MTSSKQQLKTLAFIVWFTGFFSLAIKSFKLFQEAYTLNDNLSYLLAFIALGLIIALIKVKYIFIKTCQRNMKRIDKLKEPKIWNFYRFRFFLFLITLISLGAFLSRWASGSYEALITVAIVDMSVGLALLFSGIICWKGVH